MDGRQKKEEQRQGNGRRRGQRRRAERRKKREEKAISSRKKEGEKETQPILTTGRKRKRLVGESVTNSGVSQGANDSSDDPTTLPLPFPSHLAVPPQGFLRDQDPYKESFRTALETSYQGFATDIVANDKDNNADNDDDNDDDDNNGMFEHSKIQQALKRMETAGLFRTDVTQPFGLGTKCAKTYVTRCLLGDYGTTYKYLGLRMFAHSWDWKADSAQAQEENEKEEKRTKRKRKEVKAAVQQPCQEEMSLADALSTMARLNDKLTVRTKVHLQALAKTRGDGGGGGGVLRGRGDCPKFDVALINRMEHSKDLKKEPHTGEGRCSVSWHADSCLEHYSTIAVYHSLQAKNKKKKEDTDKKKKKKKDAENAWSVALRVAHHSEGPGASRRGVDISSSVVTETPPIAVSLPSGSAYYLLEDFNHHHQHAVLSSSSSSSVKLHDTVRFSCTHRLLREGHNVSFVLERCRAVCGHFHRKGPKIWRSEQLCLTELESEWLRQFYIQGSGHKDNLWKVWKEPMESLWKYWSQLEERTKAVVELFRAAAEEKCGGNISFAWPPFVVEGDASGSSCNNSQAPRGRKVREKRKRAALALEDILQRGGDGGCGASKNNGGNVMGEEEEEDVLFEPFAQLLEERANLRQQWEDREQDSVFQRMDSDYKPIKFPARFGVSLARGGDDGEKNEEREEKNDVIPVSPLGGSPTFLRRLASHVRDWGKSYRCGVPHGDYCKDASPEESTTMSTFGGGAERDDAHAKSIGWEGWSSPTRLFGLEMQQPWSQMLLEGSKTTEVRGYPLPEALWKQRIVILESQAGEAGVSAVPNVVHLMKKKKAPIVRAIGWCTFESAKLYKSKVEFEADAKRHRVQEGSGYEWKEGQNNELYGWTVGLRGQYHLSEQHPGDQDDGAGNDEKPPQLRRAERRMRSLFEIYKASDTVDSGDSTPTAPFSETTCLSGNSGGTTKRRKSNKKRKSTPQVTRASKVKKKKRF